MKARAQTSCRFKRGDIVSTKKKMYRRTPHTGGGWFVSESRQIIEASRLALVLSVDHVSDAHYTIIYAFDGGGVIKMYGSEVDEVVRCSG